MSDVPCSTCLGSRLRDDAASYRFEGNTIGDLCDDLAGRIEVPVFESVRMLGRECETAGTFLAIRNMLIADGADGRRIGPSSPRTSLATPRYLRRCG